MVQRNMAINVVCELLSREGNPEDLTKEYGKEEEVSFIYHHILNYVLYNVLYNIQ